MIPPPADRIKKFRCQLGLSTQELAQRISGAWMAHHVERMESGDRDPLNVEVRTALRIAKALEKTVEEVFGC